MQTESSWNSWNPTSSTGIQSRFRSVLRADCMYHEQAGA